MYSMYTYVLYLYIVFIRRWQVTVVTCIYKVDISIHIYTSAHTHTHTHTHIHTHTHMYMYISYIYMYNTYIYIHIYVCSEPKPSCLPPYMYYICAIRTCTYMRVYIYTFVHAYAC